MEQNFTLKDYLDAAGDAAKRTRFVIVIIVITSILTIASFLNSLQTHWMIQRIQATANDPGLANPMNSYVASKFPRITDQVIFDDTKREFYSALVKAYVDNTFTVQVPFFGITFDVNDLGLLSGFAFFVLLILFRFSLMREYENTYLAFEAVGGNNEDKKILYNLLSMRQVLTIPPMLKSIPRTHQGEGGFRWATIIPKILSLLPAAILLIVIGYDIQTANIGDILSHNRTLFHFIASSILGVLVLVTTGSCLRVWVNIDNEWRTRWKTLTTQDGNSTVNPKGS